MSKDRHAADPAIETPAPLSMAAAETQDAVGAIADDDAAGGTADDQEALAAVEGGEGAAEKASRHESSEDNTATDATPSPEAEAVEAAPAADPDQVEATAVLVLDDEPVALTEPPQTDPSDVDWAAALAETELSQLPAADDDEYPLLDDELEHGIASVFATLHAAALRGDVGDAEEASGPLSDTDAIDGITFRLLGELDRLWHRAA